VKPPAFDYHAPTSVEEAVGLLGSLGGDAKVLAGGQSLVPLLNMRLVTPAALVDIGRIGGLDSVEVADDQVRVGAGVRHTRLEHDADAAAAIPILRRALRWVAHPVIRNRGTVVGSLAHADPAAELPAVLALLDGHVELVSTEGRRRVAARDYLLGPLESDTRPGELAVAAAFPVPEPRTGSAVLELARRHGDYALAGVAATVTLDEDRRVGHARAAFLGVGGTPVVVDLDEVLVGQPYDALDVEAAVQQAREAIDPEDDIHATASYRRHLAGVLLGRSLEQAAIDAAGRGVT
jgi:aerobic carbon-monoxide dehydrogenase medium subunit